MTKRPLTTRRRLSQSITYFARMRGVERSALRRAPSEISMAAPSGRTVSIVIPSWNGRHLLESVCLPSLSKQTFTRFSVIVVDNGSSDGTVEYLRRQWPDVEVVRLDCNLGFAAAANLGILRSESDFVALVNNDVELHPDWLKEMVAGLEDQPEAVFAASKILDFADRSVISTVGDRVSIFGDVSWRGFGDRDTGQYDHPERVFSACAAAAMYRRDAFSDVGLFDEDFFAYAEDVDWGFRAQLAGSTCWYVPLAIAYHMNGATSASVTGWRAALMARNTYWLIVKNCPASVVRKHLPRLAFVVARRFYRLFRDDPHVGLRMAILALALTPRMLRKRRDSYARRRVGDEYLLRVLQPAPPLGSDKLEEIQRVVRLISMGLRRHSMR